METVLWIALGIVVYTCFCLVVAKAFGLNDRRAAAQRRRPRGR